MNRNVIIDRPDRLEDEIEGFKLDAVDEEKNYTAARMRLCRDPENHQPVLFYSQELSRNFRDQRDPFGKRHLIKVFTPGQFAAAADEAIIGKFQDTILAHKSAIPDYSPLTDIHSAKMNLFLDEDTAQFMEDSDSLVYQVHIVGAGSVWQVRTLRYLHRPGEVNRRHESNQNHPDEIIPLSQIGLWPKPLETFVQVASLAQYHAISR